MITNEVRERVRGWFAGRLPAEWQAAPADISIDREEITVQLTIPDVELAADATEVTRSEARAGRAKAFREETRDLRMEIAREAEHRYEVKVSWGVTLADHSELWTRWSTPVWHGRDLTRWPGVCGWLPSTRMNGSLSCGTP